jgi:hypothetical protein
MTDNLFKNDEGRATKADDDFYIPTAEVDALPEYEGTTNGDRASYLFKNADALAAQAVANAQLKRTLIYTEEVEAMARSDADLFFDSAPNQLAAVSKEFEQADYLADQEAAEIIEDKKEAWTKESIAGAAKFMSDLQRAREMQTTREQRVSEAVDAAWPVPDNAAE